MSIVNKKILVTGGAGFIGSHLAKKLMDLDHQVIIVDNFSSYYDPKLKEERISKLLYDYNFELKRVDIRDFESLRKIFLENQIDIICHLAAQAGVRFSLKNPFIYEETNVRGTLNLLDLAKEFKIKGFIFASSSSVYGASKKIPFSENDPILQPISLYGATKKAAEALVFSYHHLYKIPSTILRYFSVYGPFWRPDLALYKFVQAILNDQPIEVYNFGKMKRDFTYIDDIVEGTISALERNYPFEIFNLGNNHPIELNYFIESIEKLLGKKAKKILLPIQPGEVPVNWADISKAQKLLNYHPKVTFEEGLKKTIDWFKHQ
jgi:UDP-glucuronate 4-epimerase